MRLQVELPEVAVTCSATLYEAAAPRVTAWLAVALATPFSARTRHACFDGHEVFCLLPGSDDLPLENRTMRPRPGEIMFFHAAENEFAFLSDDRLTAGAPRVYEVAFCYGEVDLRHYWEEGMHGSLIGVVDDNLDDFAAACLQTLDTGATSIVLSLA